VVKLRTTRVSFIGTGFFQFKVSEIVFAEGLSVQNLVVYEIEESFIAITRHLSKGKSPQATFTTDITRVQTYPCVKVTSTTTYDSLH
jgi:hypothetical protein